MQQQSLPGFPRVQTPWGVADDVTPIAPGIIWISTPSHGGFWLSPERRAEMPPLYRDVVPFAGPGWFEEDCDWALVALSFPDLFSPADLDCARGIRAWQVQREQGQA